jgi:murein DD-endopeptidase MepM/ murein hydrolase activator NlpD
LCALALLSGCVFYSRELPASIEYTVRPGETLSEIGNRFMVSTATLQRANGIRDPKKLQAGRQIVIPLTPPSEHVDRAIRHGQSGRAGLKRTPPPTPVVRLTGAAHYIGHLEWPIESRKVNSRFGWRNGRFHEGVDIKAKSGTPVYAAHAGRVVYSASGMRGYGRVVVVRGQGIMSVYAHNSRNIAKAGTEVEQGELIAKSGESGRTRGPHLHFEIRIRDKNRKNVAVNPLTFYPGSES